MDGRLQNSMQRPRLLITWLWSEMDTAWDFDRSMRSITSPWPLDLGSYLIHVEPSVSPDACNYTMAPQRWFKGIRRTVLSRRMSRYGPLPCTGCWSEINTTIPPQWHVMQLSPSFFSLQVDTDIFSVEFWGGLLALTDAIRRRKNIESKGETLEILFIIPYWKCLYLFTSQRTARIFHRYQ